MKCREREQWCLGIEPATETILSVLDSLQMEKKKGDMVFYRKEFYDWLRVFSPALVKRWKYILQ